ncbi:MAG TPA: dihydrofolate reductase family protein [Candidatus Paceibacterota bacterium]|nr:dihydrofolate reductase family protein [Candidatus Paceibacterota bacterium]
MRKIIVQEFITLDGVMQAPGGPEEDTSLGFKYGGWTAPYFQEADAEAGELMQKWLQPTDLLLGRKTFDIFAAYWPSHSEMWPGIMDVTKYCVSTTLSASEWKNSVFLKDVEAIKKLKQSGDTDIQVIGSGNLCQTLFKHDLVDELRLMSFPITLAQGKRLFGEGTIVAAFTLGEKFVASNGVIYASYKRAGDVQTGTVG